MIASILTMVKIMFGLWCFALFVVYGSQVAHALAEKYKTLVKRIREAEIDKKIEDAILYAEEWGRKFAKRGQDKFDKAVIHAAHELADVAMDIEEIQDRIVSRLALMRSEVGGALIGLGEKIKGD